MPSNKNQAFRLDEIRIRFILRASHASQGGIKGMHVPKVVKDAIFCHEC